MGFPGISMMIRVAFSIEKLKKKCSHSGLKALKDPYFPKHLYRAGFKALYGLHQAPRAWYERLSAFLLQHNYRRGTIDKTLFIKKDSRDILLVQVYVDDISFGSTNKAWCEEFEVLMKGEFEMSAIGEMSFFLGLQVKDMLTKFDMESVRTATTPYAAAKTKLKDEPDPPVNVHLYRTPDWVTLIQEDFQVSKRATKIRLVVIQFSGRRLISMQCKNHTIVATSSTEAEYVAAASCCGQVLWIQNQLLDYGFNFMNTKIFIDNQSTICIVKNPVFHQRTKHIEIRHHFIRDANEKNLIQVMKIHTDDNVANLLTKAFDGPRFEYLVVHIGMVNPSFVNRGRVVNTAASCTFFLLTGWFLLLMDYANGSVFMLVGILLLVDSFLLIGCVFVLFAWFLLLVDSFCWLNTFCCGVCLCCNTSNFLPNSFCCAQFDIAGWLVSATGHLVSAGSLQSCWCNNVSAA
ncbi:putative ribonuclease H-like domain-containing protein [Tanacetum coccineum]|uniref:Ribonuclease H-like domain-containing protein n=1 Tax=Tanacetum coccineum TaxID=301880 RepID=A0ABQ4WS14_9ASTR